MILLIDSEDDSEESNEWQNIESGTVLKKIEISSTPGRLLLHAILKGVSV